MNRCQKGIIVAVGDYPDGSATAIRLGMLARTLNRGGLNVEILLIHSTSRQTIPENKRTAGEIDGVRFRYCNGKTLRPAGLLPAFADTLAGIWATTRFVFGPASRSVDFVIFYTPNAWLNLLPVAAAVARKIPVFIEACEIRSKTTGRGRFPWIQKLVNSGDALFERTVPLFSKGVIAISRSIRDFYRVKGVPEEDLFFLPTLVDVKQYAAASDDAVQVIEDKQYILNSGKLSEKDGIRYLIAAFKKTAQKNKDLHLVFTGGHSRWRISEITASIRNEAIRERILFTGYLPRKALIRCYQRAAGLISCRSKSEYAQFGMPVKLAEYLATGTPALVTRVGDVGHYLVDGTSAYIADPESPASIALKLEELLSSQNRAERVGACGQQIASEWFDYRKYSVSLKRFIQQRV